jgi:flagellar hook-length control protein FliK
MTIQDVVSALVTGAGEDVAAAGAPEGAEGFFAVLEAALSGDVDAKAALAAMAEAAGGIRVDGASASPPEVAAAEGEGNLDLTTETGRRTAQLDAVVGLYLVAALVQQASAVGTGETAATPTGEGGTATSGVTAMGGGLKVPRAVEGAVSALVASNVALPEALGILAELTGVRQVAEGVTAAQAAGSGEAGSGEGGGNGGGTAARSVSLTALDRAVASLLAQTVVPDGAATATTERLQVGALHSQVVGQAEAVLADQPELLASVTQWCEGLRAQYVEAPRADAAGSTPTATVAARVAGRGTSVATTEPAAGESSRPGDPIPPPRQALAATPATAPPLTRGAATAAPRAEAGGAFVATEAPTAGASQAAPSADSALPTTNVAPQASAGQATVAATEPAATRVGTARLAAAVEGEGARPVGEAAPSTATQTAVAARAASAPAASTPGQLGVTGRIARSAGREDTILDAIASAARGAQAPVAQAQTTNAVAARADGVRVPTTVDRGEVLAQVAEGLARMDAARDRGTLVLRLHPAHLGELRVAVSVSDGAVRATITTQNAGVRAALESDIGQLRQALADAGLSVDSLQVSVDSGAAQYSPRRDPEQYARAYRSFEADGGSTSSVAEALPGLGLLAASHSGSTLSLLA